MSKKNEPVALELAGKIYHFIPETKKTWRLTSDLPVLLSQEIHQGSHIQIEAGFITDFRSGPDIVNALAPKTGMWYVIHDWMYQHQYSTKLQADQEQDYWMRQYGVERKVRNRINKAVNVFGCKYWHYYSLGGTFPYTYKKYCQLVRDQGKG